MKYKFSISIFLICCIGISINTVVTDGLISAIKKNSVKAYEEETNYSKFDMESNNNNEWLISRNKLAKHYSRFAQLANCAEKPLKKTCKRCLKPGKGFKFFFFYQAIRHKKYNYKFLIHYNDKEKEVVISFAGPSIKSFPKYVRYIYSSGFYFIKYYKIQIEKEYHRVYFKKLRKMLMKKIKKIRESGRKKYKFIFAGHSIGGSLAMLAAYDLTQKQLIDTEVNKTKVFTYGALRIGDKGFVTSINSSFLVFRIVRSDDFIVRIPNCYYSPISRNWRCFTVPIITKYILKESFPLRIYLKSYAVVYKQYITFFRKKEKKQ